jgi:uncharacterized membrane protein
MEYLYFPHNETSRPHHRGEAKACLVSFTYRRFRNTRAECVGEPGRQSTVLSISLHDSWVIITLVSCTVFPCGCLAVQKSESTMLVIVVSVYALSLCMSIMLAIALVIFAIQLCALYFTHTCRCSGSPNFKTAESLSDLLATVLILNELLCDISMVLAALT